MNRVWNGTRWTSWSLLSVLLIALLAGCSDTYEPVAINESVDVCEVCGMQIKDDQHATQIILEGGKAVKFDDIGDMYRWKKENPSAKIAVEYVRDYYSKEWLAADQAVFAYDAAYPTPMAFGVYSFKDNASAEKRISEEKKGALLTYKQLQTRDWPRNMEMMRMKMQQNMKQNMQMNKNNMKGM